MRALHELEDLEPLFYTFVYKKVTKNYRQIYGKSKAGLSRNLSTGTPQKDCNFSHVCLLVRMASKTVTRSID